MPTSKTAADPRKVQTALWLQGALVTGWLMLASCDRTRPTRASTREATPAKAAAATPAATPAAVTPAAAPAATTPEVTAAALLEAGKPLRHQAQPIVPSENEAFATLIAENPGSTALARLRRHLLGEPIYRAFLTGQQPDSAPSLDEITRALPGLGTLPELATRAEQLLTRASSLASREQDPASLGRATLRLLAQTAESLRLLEQSLSPALESLRGPILRRLDARILTARKVEDASFAPITRELLIQRDRVQRIGDLIDSQCASLELRRKSLTRIVSTPTLFEPETLSEASTMARSIATRLHKTLSSH